MRETQFRRFRLNLDEIQSSLLTVKEVFNRLNQSFNTPRDPLTDEVVSNMMAGYRYVDNLLANGIDLFANGKSKHLLELNARVLCGTQTNIREQFASHINETEKRFYDLHAGGVQKLVNWLEIHTGDTIWKRTAGAYIHVLGQPQLYIEGNHRTGALIMTYMLAREGCAPFVVTADNAKAYFDPSTQLRKTRKSSLNMLIRLPQLIDLFANFLKAQADIRYLRD